MKEYQQIVEKAWDSRNNINFKDDIALNNIVSEIISLIDNGSLRVASKQNNKWIVNQKNFDEQNFEDLLLKIIKNKEEYLVKKKNLANLNYQNTWNNVNQNLLSILNEN